MRLLTREHGMADIPKTEALFSHFAAHPIAPLFSVPKAFDSGDLWTIREFLQVDIMVELRGFEPLTSSVQGRRSPS